MTGNTIVLGLKEIADWHLKSRDEIDSGACWAEMPSFQRGLVWSPAQIEVLWDSIMRGIPIGALSLLPIEGSERFSRKSTYANLAGAFWIVDGQQRSSAIALGFETFPTTNRPILWLDLYPDRTKKSRRKYFFYVTTPGRPWGYGITNGSDEKHCEQVSVDKYRSVLREELNWTNIGAKPETFKMWPVKANLPVPFFELRKLFAVGKLDDVIHELATGEENWRRHFRQVIESHATDKQEFLGQVIKEIRFAFEGIDKVVITKTIGLIAEGGLSGDENETSEADENSNIAVYFDRLNQGGTPPSREDLDYSILKSVVPELSVLDSYACGLMHPSRMANIAMLTYLTKDKWKSGVSRSEIYRLQNDLAFRDFVLAKKPDETCIFKNAMDTVSAWVCYRPDHEFGMPKVLCSAISKSDPSLYRFLILVALKANSKGWVIDRSMIIVFVTLVSWFGKEPDLDYVTAYVKLKHCGTAEDLTHMLQLWVARQIESGAMDMPPRLKDIEAIRAAAAQGEPAAVEEAWNPIGYSEGLNDIWQWTSAKGRGFLLYVCRKYLSKVFKDYDPASAIWNEDSRPWDYDHIFPQGWLQTGRGNKHGPYHSVVSEFMMSIGNIAPVPFSLNRSWHDDPPRKYLGEHNRLIHVELTATGGSIPSFVNERPRKTLEYDKVAAAEFAYITSKRWVNLYREWLMLPVEKFMSGIVDDERVKQIKTIEEFFRSRKIDSRTVYPWLDGKQYDVVEDWDLARPWIACGVEVTYCREDGTKIGCFACIVEQEGSFEVGLRRLPESSQGFDGEGDWWIEFMSKFDVASLDEALKHLDWVMSQSSVEFRREGI